MLHTRGHKLLSELEETKLLFLTREPLGKIGKSQPASPIPQTGENEVQRGNRTEITGFRM